MTTPAAASVAAAEGRGVPSLAEARAERRHGLSERSSKSPPEGSSEEPEDAFDETEGEGGPQAAGVPPGHSASPRERARPFVAGPGSEQGSYLPKRTGGGSGGEKSSEEALFEGGGGKRGGGGGGGGGGSVVVSPNPPAAFQSQSLEE